ncbi:response regulator [archaeon]|jgi:DNA-binding NtrC family response regulator|nr:response regulator [archaeon]
MSYRILIAEDDIRLYNALSRTIRRSVEGIEITHVTRGRELRSELDKIIAGEVEYDVILSDNDLDDGLNEGLNSLDYGRRIGINQAYFMMSGDGKLGPRAEEYGATGFYDKPLGVLGFGKDLAKLLNR